MAYSTETEIRNWLDNFSGAAPLTTAIIDHRITQADKQIKVDLGNTLDFDAIDAEATTPDFINIPISRMNITVWLERSKRELSTLEISALE
jgi:hypothetical protein